MPVHWTADRADVHLLMWLHFAPTQLAVSYEWLVFIDFLWRQFWKFDDFSVVHDVADLFPAAGASRMVPPPSYQTGHAKAVLTFKQSKLLFGVWEANGTFFSCAFSHFNDLLHPPCDSRIDGGFSPLGRCISGLILAGFGRALFGAAACLPLRHNSLFVFWWLSAKHLLGCWAEWENLLWACSF